MNSYAKGTDVNMAQIMGEGDGEKITKREIEIKGIIEGKQEISNTNEMESTAQTVNDNKSNDGDNTTAVVNAHASVLSPTIPQISHQEIVTYLIVSGLMGGEARRVACEERSRHLKLVPLGAVAACISRVGSQSHIRSYTDNSTNGPKGANNQLAGLTGAVTSCFPPTVGQAFCFLPLPVRTQLPVHVNAYWELSANRRDIWRYFFSHPFISCPIFHSLFMKIALLCLCLATSTSQF